jgi:hypothetical protein
VVASKQITKWNFSDMMQWAGKKGIEWVKAATLQWAGRNDDWVD